MALVVEGAGNLHCFHLLSALLIARGSNIPFPCKQYQLSVDTHLDSLVVFVKDFFSDGLCKVCQKISSWPFRNNLFCESRECWNKTGKISEGQPVN